MKTPSKSLYDALRDIVIESTEAEIDEIIRESGKNPDELLRQGKAVIKKVLAQYEKSKNLDKNS